MIKIRLMQKGAKKKPFYRIVAIDSKKKRGGEYIDILGFYNPLKKVVKIDKEKLLKWEKLGAQINLSVKKLLEQ